MRWKRCALGALSALLFSGAHAAAQDIAEAVSFVTWREPNEGAYTLGVPRGWKISGGIWRRTPVDVRSALNVVSPDEAIRLFIGDYDLIARREPDAATRIAGVQEGQVYSETLIGRYLTGAQFAQGYPAWKLCRRPQIIQSGILRRETETVNAQVAQYGRSMATAAMASVGEAIFRCREGEGFVMATTVLARPASAAGVSMWFVYQLAGFVTRDPAQGYFAKYVLSSMLASLKMNREWEARAAQAAGEHANAIMQMSNAVTPSAIQHARQQVAQSAAGGWNHPNTWGVPKITRDPGVEQRRDNANRGTREVCDDLGDCKSVDNSWTHVWRDHSGNGRPGPPSGYPPDYSGQWTPMK
ncbi:MAG: hypothetical protein E6H47_08350 [Betaproteobacteria bacterium]|nr:MAG: hypothetical protein E6H47_08350 [Betaproteobacteria bacterium]